MIGVAPDPRKTLEAVQRISVAGRGRVKASAFLEDVCDAVAEAFEFDSVAAVRYDGEAEEVGKGLSRAPPRPIMRTVNRSRASPCSQGRGRPSSSFCSPLEMSPPRSPSR